MDSESTDKKIQQLQLNEQKLQNFLIQKQNFQSQLIEIESALDQLSGKTNAYKIIGNIMIDTPAVILKSDLEQKKQLIEVRIKNLEKQEDQIKSRAKELQADVLKNMNK